MEKPSTEKVTSETPAETSETPAETSETPAETSETTAKSLEAAAGSLEAAMGTLESAVESWEAAVENSESAQSEEKEPEVSALASDVPPESEDCEIAGHMSERELRLVEENLLTLAENNPALVAILRAAGVPQRALRGLPEPPLMPAEPIWLAKAALTHIRRQQIISPVLKSVSAPDIGAATAASNSPMSSESMSVPLAGAVSSSSAPSSSPELMHTQMEGATMLTDIPDPLEAAFAGYEAARLRYSAILRGGQERDISPLSWGPKGRSMHICNPM